MSDTLVHAISRRYSGVFEPEYRLLLILPAAVVSTAGLVGFGWTMQEIHVWIVPTVLFCLASFGCRLTSTISLLYSVESCPKYPGEALMVVLFSKNILAGIVWSMSLPSWLQTTSSKRVFIVVGLIQLVPMLLAVPMYIFGKKARMWAGRRIMTKMQK